MAPVSWIPFLRLHTSASTEPESPTAANDDPNVPSSPVSSVQSYSNFEDVADKVEALQKDLIDANAQIELYRREIMELKERLRSKDQQISTQETFHQSSVKAIDRLNADLKRERRQFADSQGKLKNQHHNTCVQLTNAIAKEKSQNKRLQADLKSQRDLVLELKEKQMDMQFDLEYLKCIQQSTNISSQSASSNLDRDRQFSLPAQPFVVVLVDGDAYDWSADIFAHAVDAKGNAIPTRDMPPHLTPGSIAASRIRNAVTTSILNSNGRIPASAKILTRVFCNLAGYEGKLGLPARRMNRTPREFAVDFTQKMPLFDYFDAGRGKERVDEKIRENFHLYLSTPNCHAIFVAACLDNGFARMLEPFTGHEPSYEKIFLVSPGHMAMEVFRLDFKTVSWPNVFATAKIPGHMMQRHRSEVARLEAVGERMGVKGVRGTSENGVSETLALRVVLPAQLVEWQEIMRRAIGEHTAKTGLLSMKLQKMQDSKSDMLGAELCAVNGFDAVD